MYKHLKLSETPTREFKIIITDLMYVIEFNELELVWLKHSVPEINDLYEFKLYNTYNCKYIFTITEPD